ncbi:MAG: MBL fold metallo-hydrolase [Archaeoglobaceae archaeon]|nr:MBL fold metallo-hydrolase [Archaeoglobaceae archaeon]MDW8117875.1 MBL fold metallo-hydrolase [Archaeoglobaceae archaeon]
MNSIEIAERFGFLAYRKKSCPHLSLRIKGIDLHIDSTPRDGFNLITHAHSDHYGQRNVLNRNAIASVETAKILKAVTGKEFKGKIFCIGDNFRLGELKIETYATKHIHGATAFYLKDADLLITGDVKQWRDFPKCRVLITEATYGDPSFVFEDEIEKLLSVAKKKVCLGAYPVGKAQRVAEILRKEGHEFTAEDKIKRICSALGIEVGDSGSRIVSPRNLSDGYILTAQRYYKVPRIVISDHMDYRGIIEMVEHCKAEHVIFYHGKASERLKKELAEMGVSYSTLKDIDLILP